ncbi:MAG: LamG protein [Gammaproteobacteria bacterium]|nr:LamG protein [Gammaproteobacteria bacterium]
MNCLELAFTGARAGARALTAAAAVALVATLAACSAGGPATQVNQPTTGGTSTANQYTGPAASNADVQSFKINLWENIRVSNRCGGCHHEGGQAPMFARSDDVNLAYQAAAPLVNFTQPDQSKLVLKVASGHNCWVADPSACRDTMLTWIKAWIGAGASSSTGVILTPPPLQTVGNSKVFPADVSQTNFATTVYPLLTQFCTGCHRSDAATPQAPYFASSTLAEAYLAAQPKMDLNDPAQSRFVVRLGMEFHHCWAITPGGQPDCTGSSAAMLAAVTAMAGGINATTIDSTLVVSKALSLTQGTIASGANRYEANLIAKYEFKTGTGSTAYDTSGVNPAADLSLAGAVTWAGGWGINIAAGGKAQASTAASQKLSQMITSTGEYSIEVWAAPANVAQTEAYIVSYSGSDKTRNATLAQHGMQYQASTRSDKTDTNGAPPLLTAAGNRNAQAALQHVVLTYDPVNGQKIYVNGAFTGDADPNTGGSLAKWDNTFALVMGAETTGKEPWVGLIKFAAIHSRALTGAQVQQNFAAGVGERYFLLFDVSAQSGVPQSYVMMQASQYDSYSYLFNTPTFISLDPNAAPGSVPIKGIRIGVNGTISSSGQSYATLDAVVGGSSYTAAHGQLLSNVGAVIPVSQGPAGDLFFLTFDQLGTFQHVFVEPVFTPTPVTADNTPKPDRGVATFERLNVAMATITGVPITNTAAATTYNTVQQSLPAAPGIDAFLPSHQTAIAQLAVTYCGELVDTQSYRDAFFGTGLDAAINANTTASAFFGTTVPNTTHRPIVIDALVAKVVGTGVNPQTATAVTNELNALLTRIPGINATTANTTVSTATKAACSAVLGSAAVSLQ